MVVSSYLSFSPRDQRRSSYTGLDLTLSEFSILNRMKKAMAKEDGECIRTKNRTRLAHGKVFLFSEWTNMFRLRKAY